MTISEENFHKVLPPLPLVQGANSLVSMLKTLVEGTCSKAAMLAPSLSWKSFTELQMRAVADDDDPSSSFWFWIDSGSHQQQAENNMKVHLRGLRWACSETAIRITTALHFLANSTCPERAFGHSELDRRLARSTNFRRRGRHTGGLLDQRRQEVVLGWH